MSSVGRAVFRTGAFPYTVEINGDKGTGWFLDFQGVLGCSQLGSSKLSWVRSRTKRGESEKVSQILEAPPLWIRRRVGHGSRP
jgi:hypothetical protein